MCLHDLIVKEFERTGSVSALIYLIEHGREIEFSFEGKKYFLSGSNSEKKYLFGAIKRNKVFTA